MQGPRVALRGFTDADRPAFARMNADPEVTRYLLAPLTRAESDALVDRIRGHFERHGFGLWALEIPDHDGMRFAGFVGLMRPGFEAAFTPCVEIGWRLDRAAWGHGYATEGARLALAFGFERAGLDEIVSFTAVDNAPSRRVMERLGMTRSADEDFDHPRVPHGHPLRRHVLYRIRSAR